MLNLATIIFRDFSGSIDGRIAMLSLFVSSFLMVAIPAVILSFLLKDHRTEKITKSLLVVFLLGLYVMEWSLNPINGILFTIILVTVPLLMIECRYQRYRRDEYSTKNELLLFIFEWLKAKDLHREQERESQKLEINTQEEDEYVEVVESEDDTLDETDVIE